MLLKIVKRSSIGAICFIFFVILGASIFIINYNFLDKLAQVGLPIQGANVRVLCWVMTHPENHYKKAVHVKNTWGKRCDKLLFMSSVDDPELPSVKLNVTEGRNFLWGKVKASFKYVYENHFDEADWFMKADDDSFVVVENLKSMLSEYNPNSAIHFGGMFIRPVDKQVYFSGGSGYILSKEALKRFVEKALPNKKKCSENGTTWEEEPEIAKCLESVDAKAIDTRDNERMRFLHLNLEYYLVPGMVDSNHWYWGYIAFQHKMGSECCSETAVGFHYVKPGEMYLFHYLLYEFRSPYEFSFEKSNRSEVSDSDLPTTIEYRIGPSRQTRGLPHKVLCWHLVSNETEAFFLKNTWGKRCDKMLFMSNASNEGNATIKLPTIQLLSGSNDYLMTALEYIYDNHFTEADWFVKADVSIYLVVENLQTELKSYDPQDPIYFKSGSGYVLSKEALRRLVIEMPLLKEDCREDNEKMEQLAFGMILPSSDVKCLDCLLAKCLESVGIEKNDLGNRFLKIDLDMVSPNAYHQQKDSDTAIGFHKVTPTQLYTIDYLIYRLRPFGVSSDLDGTKYRFLVYALAMFILVYIYKKL